MNRGRPKTRLRPATPWPRQGRSRARILQPTIEQMVLPDAIDAQIFARVALANEAGVFEETDRTGIAGNAGRLEPVQPQRVEGKWNDGAHCRGHVAVAEERQAHPVAEAARLRDPTPDVGERQSA